MNIFEYLDIPERKRPFQLVKNYEEVPASKKDFPMVAQIKKDGIFAAVVVKGYSAQIFGRTGKKLTNVDLQEQDFFQVNFQKGHEGRQGIYIAELVSDDCSLEVLSGIVNPNRNKPLSEEQKEIISKAYLLFHDYLTICEFVIGKSPLGYFKRHERLYNAMPTPQSRKQVIPMYSMATEVDVEEFAHLCITHGEEGAVFKQPLGDYEAGHKGWRSMKIVRGISYDLKCIGYEEGKGKYSGKVANLIFSFKGGEVKAMLGKGWTHQDAEDMLVSIQSDPTSLGSPLGRIFEVTALQESSTGTSLRLPKVGELRHDKEQPDY